MSLIGESRYTFANTDREPINIEPGVKKALVNLLFEPELRAVGYSEFITRAIAQARCEINRQRGVSS